VPHAPRRTARLLAAAAALTLVIASGSGSEAAPGAPLDTRSERERVRQERAEAAAELDVLEATNAEVEAALDALNANVAGQEAALADAQRAAAAAEAALAEARAREAATQADIGALQATLREVAVEAYINAGEFDEATAVLQTDDIEEAVQRRSLVDLRSGQHREVLGQLETLSEELAIARAEAESAAEAAAAHQAEVDRRLGEVTAARDQQAAVAAEVDARIEAALAESAALASLDEELSRQLAAEQAALAARNRASSGGGGGGGGGTVTRTSGNVSLTTVRGITVASSIADQLDAMLGAAEADGIVLGGGGYRSSDSQWALREQNCPDAANSPPSSCRPPTARPGQSMHEQGLAIDFTYNGRVINSRSSPAFQWLAAQAGSYGFYNLPSEPWHWSTNGN
jgi:chemotaxis protein histidine kinase CheA